MLPALQRGQSHTLLWFACEASQKAFGFRSPSNRLNPFKESDKFGSSLASLRQQSKHPRPADTAEETKRKCNSRNWQELRAMGPRSATPRHAPRRIANTPFAHVVGRPFERRLRRPARSSDNCDRKRRRLSRKPKSWSAATVVVAIWLQASSSDATVGAGSVSVSDMGPRHERGKRRRRSKV